MTGGSLPPVAFAIPGDIGTLTGGFIYERRLLEELRAAGRAVAHLQLPGSFPDPTPRDMQAAIYALDAVAANTPLILDGLVFGAIETAGLARTRAQIVAMIHHPLALESGLSADRRAHLERTERDNLRLAAHVLVPSPHTARILVSDYGLDPSRLTVAPPGIDRPAGGRTPSTPPLILSVGIQHPRKGHDILLQALARLRDLPWEAVIVGDAYDRVHARELGSSLDRLGLADRVTLAGKLPAAALAALWRRAAIFALATRYEGYGMVFAEAMAHGLPIVSCRAGAVADTVAPGAGLLVPPDDAPAFAAALGRLLRDGALRDDLAGASARAGATLPLWTDTAAIAGAVLDRLAAAAPR